MGDREQFIERINVSREEAVKALLASGCVLDQVLIEELAEPGSDQRCGVNLVCRPSEEIVERIADLQHRLFEHEPEQYYYPPQDLHLTLVEVCHSRTREEAERIAAAVRSCAPGLLSPETPAAIDAPAVTFDRKGVALSFLPCDSRLQSTRQAIRENLGRNGVAVESRYLPLSAHITLLRYIRPLRTPMSSWIETLTTAGVAASSAWVLSPLWLTWGASWYGRRSRISQFGPIAPGLD